MPDCNTILSITLKVEGMSIARWAKFYVRDMTMGKCMMFALLEGYSVKAECTAQYEHATITVYKGSDCTGTAVLTQVMTNRDSSKQFSIELNNVMETAQISDIIGNYCSVHRQDCRFAYPGKFCMCRLHFL